MFLTPGGRDKNELPSGTDPAHLAEQHSLVPPLTRRSKTDAFGRSVCDGPQMPIVTMSVASGWGQAWQFTQRHGTPHHRWRASRRPPDGAPIGHGQGLEVSARYTGAWHQAASPTRTPSTRFRPGYVSAIVIASQARKSSGDSPFSVGAPQWGAADAGIKVPSCKSTVL